MGNHDFFKTVLNDHPPVKYLFMNGDLHSGTQHIFGYVGCDIYISKINISPDQNEIPDFNGEKLEHEHPIVQIFVQNGQFYALDELGHLFKLQRQEILVDDYDLFDDSPEKGEKWLLSDGLRLCEGRRVLACCWGKAGELGLLTSSQADVTFQLHSLAALSGEPTLRSITLKELGLLHLANREECLLEYIAEDKVPLDFYRSWFEEERGGEFYLATLPEGSIFAVFPGSGAVEFLYLWSASFLSAVWDFSVENGTRPPPDIGWTGRLMEISSMVFYEGAKIHLDGSERRVGYTMLVTFLLMNSGPSDAGTGEEIICVASCSLTLVSSNGGVLRLSETGELDTSYLPAGCLGAVTSCQGLLYFSDFKESFRQELRPSPASPPEYSSTCFSLPLKGIISWCSVGGTTLALSRTGQLYAVERDGPTMTDPHSTGELLPDSTLSAALIRASAALDQVNREIHLTDRYIAATLLSTRNIQFSLTAQILSVGVEEWRVCLGVECTSPDVKLTETDWLGVVSLVGGGGGGLSSCRVRLRGGLLGSAGGGGLQYLVCSLPPPHRQQPPDPPPLRLRLMLIFKHLSHLSHTSASHLPCIPVGEVVLDASYFLLPGVELETEYLSSLPADVTSLLSELALSREGESEEEVEVRVSCEDYPEDTIIPNLLKNSKALWRTSLWNNTCKERKVELSVDKKLVRVVVGRGGEVAISGCDLGACHLVKSALYATAPSGCRIHAESSHILNQLKSYGASCEVLSQMEPPPPREKIEELRKLLRDNVTAHLKPF